MQDWNDILNHLERGTLRAAIKTDGIWRANPVAKQGILEAFKAGQLVQSGPFVDKGNLLPQQFNVERGVRFVPGGSSVRRGAYLAKGVIVMPPSYVNVGAYIDEGTMVDSHVLVGSCAQIGKRVHLSAGVQIGGVLEPVGQTPVVIEDDVFVGAGCIIVEGLQISAGAVLAPGVRLSQGVPVYDCVKGEILPKGAPIPPLAVVVPGTRPMGTQYTWAREQGLQLSCALIVKYRDAKSDRGLVLEEALR